MKQLILSLLFIGQVLGSFAQTDVSLKIFHHLNNNAFSFSQEATTNEGISFNVQRLQYYLSSFSITHDGGKITQVSDVYILVNANDSLSVILGNYDITEVEAINFSVGVNAPQNNQDPTQWPQSHALYPKSPSMHWGWASGYRFVAMEGYSGASMNKSYEIHALGNENYYKISIPVSSTSDNGAVSIALNADYAKALENIDVSFGPVSHGATNQAAELLRNFRDHVFTNASGEGNVLSIAEKVASQIDLYPNPTANGQLTISNTSSSKIVRVRVLNILGELVEDRPIELHHDIAIVTADAGYYMVEVFFEDNSKIVKKVVSYQ